MKRKVIPAAYLNILSLYLCYFVCRIAYLIVNYNIYSDLLNPKGGGIFKMHACTPERRTAF